MSDKFEQWWQDNSHPTIAESSKEWASLGYQAALAHSAAALAAKDAEIERLKGELFDKAFDWRGMADAKGMEQIERLRRVVNESLATVILRRSKHDTVICGRNNMEAYLRRGYAVDFKATDEVRSRELAAAQQEG